MKKAILSFVIAFAVFAVASAQAESEHLSIMGIPIEGSMTAFCLKLKSKGFTSLGRENDITLFSGDFTGRKSTVGVVATDDGKNVFGVGVFFDPSGEWKTLVNTYDYYKGLYTRKYGEPAFSEERNPARSDSNTSLMLALHEGKVTYFSTWNVKGGDIQISINKSSGFYEGSVIISYRDSQNVEAKIQDDMEDI